MPQTLTKANIYYSLDTASVKITVADKAVKVSMFGRETDVEVDFIQLDKIGVEN